MAIPRKKWATSGSYPAAPRTSHSSRLAAYRDVEKLAAEFRGGGLRKDLTHVTVWVDEGLGRGWESYERIALADLPAEGGS
jgi:hypothetical protein